VDGAGGGDQEFAGVASTAAGAAYSCASGDLALQRFDVGGDDAVEPLFAPGCAFA
jgi:hypothetical protein